MLLTHGVIQLDWRAAVDGADGNDAAESLLVRDTRRMGTRFSGNIAVLPRFPVQSRLWRKIELVIDDHRHGRPKVLNNDGVIRRNGRLPLLPPRR